LELKELRELKELKTIALLWISTQRQRLFMESQLSLSALTPLTLLTPES
jgi:hypothetical protein